MARHAQPRTPRRSALLKAGLTATAAGAAVFGLGSAAAPAAPAVPAPLPAPVSTLAGSDAVEAGQGLVDGAGHSVGPLTRLHLDPPADTGVGPLDKGMDSRVAEGQQVGADLVKDHATKGGILADLPMAGPLSQGLLPA
ncbi:hypothetical protein J7E93_14675 [Streptomyces sp. ISL-36]|uniref:hypothetical protein n=1 Tax=Streptomyces sp. ISL-36 TaxID=2819182 RepID=UPI001BEA4107|nr:hypothetical protein [Streptomyces sp. ISL-36]MBT2441334.1 hypothetical protein [Streptomyces sp. ISL-36]